MSAMQFFAMHIYFGVTRINLYIYIRSVRNGGFSMHNLFAAWMRSLAMHGSTLEAVTAFDCFWGRAGLVSAPTASRQQEQLRMRAFLLASKTPEKSPITPGKVARFNDKVAKFATWADVARALLQVISGFRCTLSVTMDPTKFLTGSEISL